MKARILPLTLFIALLLVLPPSGGHFITAQGPEPPGLNQPLTGLPSLPHGGPYQTPDGLWVMPAGARLPIETAGLSPQATGGPDDFGYTWDDLVPLNWIDATDGTDTGMSGYSYGQRVGPIWLPFQFKYYENTYNQVYIAASGYLAFTDEGIWPSQPRVPSPAKPNNIIAPYATPLRLATSGPANRVYYKSGGSAPNRYFVVEWYQVKYYEGEQYTFEVILYENGDIVFQYQTMSYGYSYACGVAGIEDSTGLDGLNYVPFCRQAPSNKAVRFTRPALSARVSVRPLYQGRFTRAGETVAFQVPIRNTGELGSDTYDLTLSSSWPATLYHADGATPLTDTDGDGAVDTGSLAQGGTFTVTVKVQTPGMVNVGDNNSATLTARSSLNTSKSKTVTLQTAIPAPFAQVYEDDADGAMSLYLVQPNAQALKKATPDRYHGFSPAVAEMPNGFAYFWIKGRSVGNVYVAEVEYTLLDRSGNATRAVGKLTDHSAATMSTYDYAPAIAVAPNGRIGVLWYRYLWNSNTSQSNYNIWFAILDSSGKLVYGPANLTNNNAWGTWSDYGVPRFYSPRIAATGDNRFVLAWERYSQESSGGLADIYYAVRDTNGTEVKGVSKFTNGVAGSKYYYEPTLATLTGNRALLAYTGPNGISYAVLDSSGNTLKPETVVGGYGWGPDAVQLSSGNIVVAWSGWANDKNTIMFAVLNETTYDVMAGPTMLNNPAAPTGDAYVSVAADAADRAILTWMDYEWSYRRNLYYALVNRSGSILTPPTIFRTSQAASPYIASSYEGYGNTSYSLVTPTSNDVDGRVTSSLAGGPPGGVAAISALVGNYGRTTATSVVLTATLDSNLTYAGAIPNPTAVSTPTVVWNLPDLGFLGGGQVVLWATVPSTTIGTRYPVTWTLTSAGTEATPDDNTAVTQVMIARQVFLPLVLRNYP